MMHKHLALVFVTLCIIGSFAQDPATSSTDEPTSKTDSSPVTSVTTPSAPITTSTSKIEPSKTTPPEPTTTSVPITTITTTEAVPTTTSTAAPTTSSTAAPTTTAVTPTESPSPTAGNWTVTNTSGWPCIRAIMAVQFRNLPGKITVHNLLPNASATDSSCHPSENNTQVLVLKDEFDFEFKLTFSRDDLSTYVRNISLTVPGEEPMLISEKYFVVHAGKSYYCSSKSDVSVGNSTIEFSSLHIQSFMHGVEEFSEAEDCAADDKMNDIVPISVACALGGMVIIILIGYLVTRRQSRQRGYQSV